MRVLWLAFLTAIRPLTLTIEVLVKTWYYRQRYSPLRRCQDQLGTATTYTEWATAAHELDVLQGYEAWKNEPASPDYDFALVQARIAQLREALATSDLAVLMFLARTFVTRNLGRMSSPALYTHTHIGTKRLVDEYHGQVIAVLQHVLDSPRLALDAKYEFFTQLRQAYGRTALLLSGGASFGLFHIGVLKALFACQLLPRVVSGSSSGSIMAAMLCTRTDSEALNLLDPQKNRLNLDVFEAPERAAAMAAAGIGVSWMHRITHLLKHGSLYESEVLIKSLRENIGEMTFLEAYNRTRRILNITVSTSTVFENQRLLNYLTAPNVVIWSAVAASCAAPFLFPPAPILAKDNSGRYVQWDGAATEWIDGSVQHDLPMQRLSELFNINHFIVSQVNPYVVPFMHLTHPPSALLTPPRLRPTAWATSSAWRSLIRVAARLVADEVRYRAYQLQTLGIFPHLMFRLQAILAQKYSGDITIVPDFRLTDYRGVIINPTRADFDRYATLGERAAWPKISIIRNHCEVELFLDKVIYQLRTQKLGRSAPSHQTNTKSPSSKSKHPKRSRTTVTTPVVTPTTDPTLPSIAGSYFSLPASKPSWKRDWSALAQPSLAPLSPLVTQQSARAAMASAPAGLRE
ncbi:Lipase 5 [Dimargaris verticillata]|uniref:Lipase 5 n=1 Tax=Dimargaris verticillata TaxID=2761393 RepID=A0A9W8B836_9FUNG|nr:Lipase 5 [Dimargaris verticillata]